MKWNLCLPGRNVITRFTAAGDTAIQRALTQYDGIDTVRNFLNHGDVRFFNILISHADINTISWVHFVFCAGNDSVNVSVNHSHIVLCKEVTNMEFLS